uniref:Uncharacterized protein n=1 Tax=Bicosoecida sp. CB-2014 TaxID=1486930 RepID=A0A7S1CJV7_9STRA
MSAFGDVVFNKFGVKLLLHSKPALEATADCLVDIAAGHDASAGPELLTETLRAICNLTSRMERGAYTSLSVDDAYCCWLAVRLVDAGLPRALADAVRLCLDGRLGEAQINAELALSFIREFLPREPVPGFFRGESAFDTVGMEFCEARGALLQALRLALAVGGGFYQRAPALLKLMAAAGGAGDSPAVAATRDPATQMVRDRVQLCKAGVLACARADLDGGLGAFVRANAERIATSRHVGNSARAFVQAVLDPRVYGVTQRRVCVALWSVARGAEVQRVARLSAASAASESERARHSEAAAEYGLGPVADTGDGATACKLRRRALSRLPITVCSEVLTMI